jgi:hypothetical protein
LIVAAVVVYLLVKAGLIPRGAVEKYLSFLA